MDATISLGYESRIFYELENWSMLQKVLTNKQYSQLGVLVDTNTANHCLPLILDFLEGIELNYFVLEVRAGEESKSLETASFLWKMMTEYEMDRKAVILNLGGGMVCDLGGFVASIYKRGIDFINMPTSLLGMVDASIGGKCGIDFQYFKNQLGCFQNASAVVIESSFLQTLPKEEYLSGLAEMFKHALIADRSYWEELIALDIDFRKIDEKHIRRSLQIKSSVVEIDPKEGKDRKKLNFGHTIGHAVESYFLNKNRTIQHGFAIAVGMIAESWLSVEFLGMPKEEMHQIHSILSGIYPSVEFPESKIPNLIKYIQQDKKNLGRKPQFTLLKRIGEAEVNIEVDDEKIAAAIKYYLNH